MNFTIHFPIPKKRGILISAVLEFSTARPFSSPAAFHISH